MNRTSAAVHYVTRGSGQQLLPHVQSRPCRPSCPARPPKRENVIFHISLEDAEKAGFRACKRCDPNGRGLASQHSKAVAFACRLIREAETFPNLNQLAESVKMSPGYFHRLFSHEINRAMRPIGSLQTATGASLAEAMLSAKRNSFQITLPTVSASTVSSREGPSFLEFLKLGVEHILTGYDHLLFLFGLMVVCRGFRSILTVITCFTVAHSITLALAALDIVRLPGRIVEPMIAASIAYVGIENLFRGDAPKWRSLIAFFFGLVHGLGFADALRELGINSGRFGIVVPLVGFNIGVELGQLCVAAIVLPILWNLRRNPLFVRQWVPICSLAIAFAGSFWMVERILQH